MGNHIGTAIKKIRESINMTQRSLSNEICTIRQLARIEANESSPSAYLLTEFSLKLGNELFSYFPYSSDADVYELKNQIEELILLFEKQQFTCVLRMINESVLLQRTTCGYAKQEVTWLTGALGNHIDVGKKIDKQYFIDILKIDRDFKELSDLFKCGLKPIEYKVINSLIFLFLENGEFKEAEKLLVDSIHNFENKHVNIVDSSYVKFIYNLSRLYLINEKFNETLHLTRRGIDYCLRNNKISYLAGLNNIHGRALYNLGNKIEGKKHILNYINLTRIVDPAFDYEKTIQSLKSKYNIEPELFISDL